MKQYTIKEVFKNTNGEIEEKQSIKLGENDLIRIFEIYKDTKFEDTIEEIIKVDLPSKDEEALDILENGLIFNEELYVNLATTVGLMKKDSITDFEYSGEYFFIKATYSDFVKEFENVISLGKLEEKEEEMMCINKDVVSRVSLAFSTGQRVHIKGIKKAILPEMTYTYVNNYLQFADKEIIDKNGKKKLVIDLDNFELKQHKNLEVKHIAMDGSGFIMPHLINKIGCKLNVEYPLSWIGIREIGTASKGLLVKFDFKKYLREEHGLNKLIVKDMWGNDIDLFEVDVIMNESQVKWGKWFNSYGEIEELIREEKYTSYRELFEGFNIVKYNKEEPKAYTEANYQIITNLALTPKELDEISKETEETYNKVIKADSDATRIMLGDVARDEQDVLSASTKIHKLLQLDSRLIRIQSAKKVRESLINKKVNNLAGGSIYLKGNYKVILKDAISYLDSIVEQKYQEGKLVGSMSQRGLLDNTNYVPGELGKRVLARCPLNSATELVKTELVLNELYNKYFGELSSDICFYPFNDFMMRQSGADEDLDITFVIDEEKIYNSVIDDIKNGTTWYFRNQFDGSSSKEIYTRLNMYEQTVKCRGNRIGELSNKGAIISNLIQEMPYKRAMDGKLNSYSKMKKQAGNTLKSDLKLGLSKGTILDYKNISNDEIKEFILKNFQEYKIYSYFTLYLQMVAIDFVKTGIDVKVEEEDILGKITAGKRKPRYIYYAKYKTENKQVKFGDTSYSNTLLNNYCSRIISELGHKARESENSQYNNDILFKRMLDKNDAELNQELFENLSNIYLGYLSLRDSIEVKKEIQSIKLKQDQLKQYSSEYMELQDQLITLYEDRYKEYLKIDIEIAKKLKELKQGYTAKEILKVLCEVKSDRSNRVNSRFVIEFCFEELEKHILDIKEGSLEFYKVDDTGNIRYLYQLYKIFNTNKISKVNLSEQDHRLKKEKVGLIKTTRIGKLTHNKLTNSIKVEGKKVFNNQNELLGTLFKKDIESGTYQAKFDFTTSTNTEYNTAKSMEIELTV